MILSHSTLVLPPSFVDYVRADVLRQLPGAIGLRQISGLYGKVELRGSGPESSHHLPVTVMENGAVAHYTSQHIVVYNIQYDPIAVDTEDKYSAVSVLAFAYLEKNGQRQATLALRFRVFLYQEHNPNAYIKAL